MLQRIAFAHTETTVARALNDLGFRGTYDAIYVPRNRRKNTNLGYAFVNFLHPAYAAEATNAPKQAQQGDTRRGEKVDCVRSAWLPCACSSIAPKARAKLHSLGLRGSISRSLYLLNCRCQASVLLFPAHLSGLFLCLRLGLRVPLSVSARLKRLRHIGVRRYVRLRRPSSHGQRLPPSPPTCPQRLCLPLALQMAGCSSSKRRRRGRGSIVALNMCYTFGQFWQSMGCLTTDRATEAPLQLTTRKPELLRVASCTQEHRSSMWLRSTPQAHAPCSCLRRRVLHRKIKFQLSPDVRQCRGQ